MRLTNSKAALTLSPLVDIAQMNRWALRQNKGAAAIRGLKAAALHRAPFGGMTCVGDHADLALSTIRVCSKSDLPMDARVRNYSRFSAFRICRPHSPSPVPHRSYAAILAVTLPTVAALLLCSRPRYIGGMLWRNSRGRPLNAPNRFHYSLSY